MIQTKLPAPPPSSSALGRPLDPRYRSNVLAVVGSGLAASTVFLLGLISAEPLPASALAAGLAVFLAWAIGRDLDPDRPSTAAAAMVVSFASTFFFAPSLLFGFGLLIGTRLIVGTVGLPLKTFDRAALLVIAGLMGTGVNSLAATAALVAGLIVSDGWSARTRLLGVGSLAIAALVFALRGAGFNFTFEVETLWVVGALLVATWLVVPAATPHTKTDVGQQRLSGSRVTVARIVTSGSVILSGLLGGTEALHATAGVAGAVLIGTAIVRTISRSDTV